MTTLYAVLAAVEIVALIVAVRRFETRIAAALERFADELDTDDVKLEADPSTAWIVYDINIDPRPPLSAELTKPAGVVISVDATDAWTAGHYL